MFNFFGGKGEEKENKIKSENFQPQEHEDSEKQNIFSIGFDALKKTVSNTSKILVGDVVNSLDGESEFSEFVLDDMEDMLIRADLTVNYAADSVDRLGDHEILMPA